jgi:hypothetical protein
MGVACNSCGKDQVSDLRNKDYSKNDLQQSKSKMTMQIQNASKTEPRRKNKRGTMSTEGSMIDSYMNFNRGSEPPLTTSGDGVDASRCSESTFNRFGSSVMTNGIIPSGGSTDTMP